MKLTSQPSRPGRRGRPQRILAATADCLVRDGLAKVRMAGIAKAAGVSSGLLHYHFDTKEQLFAEVLSYSSAAYAVLTCEALERAGTEPAQRLMAFLDRCLPSDEELAHEWLLWQELALLCMREPDLANVSADLYESLYATATPTGREGHRGRCLRPAAPRGPARRRDRPGAVRRGRHPRPLRRQGPDHGSRPAPWWPSPSASSSGTTAPCPPDPEAPGGAGVNPSVSRRSLLKGGLALGATAAASACAYIPSDEPARAAPLPKSAKAKIDGDLVYFNWADYLDPSVMKGFQREYGVKIIQSNFDSMEGMYAKIAAGNQYDIIFPIAKWVVKMRQEGKLRAIDHAQLTNADQVFYSGSYFNDPWYDPKSAASVPFTVYKTGIGWRTDKVRRDDRQLARPVEPPGDEADLHPRRPGRGARHGRPPARATT